MKSSGSRRTGGSPPSGAQLAKSGPFFDPWGVGFPPGASGPDLARLAASATGCDGCWLLPPPLNYFCYVLCTDQEYGFHYQGGDSGFTTGECDEFVITVRPIDTLAATGQGSEAPSEEHDWCDPGVVVDDVVATSVLRADAASRIYRYAWLSAPPELLELWPDPEWRFDDSACSWIYLSVGYDPNYAVGDQCVPVTQIDPDYTDSQHTFVVVGLIPYVTYSVAVTQAPEAHGPQLGVRIRYWAGIIDHFSFFPPNHDEQYVEYGIRQLPVGVFDQATEDITGRGILTEWFMSLVRSVGTSISWREGPRGEVRQVGSVFDCDPSRNPEASRYNDSYVAADGKGPSGLCFSSHSAFDAGGGEMTSFLGNAVWGEVCFVVPEEGYDEDLLVSEGFTALFGSHVKLSFQIDFFGRYGDFRGNQSLPALGASHFVRRTFCLGADDLQPREQLKNVVDELRSDAWGRWMFRETDTEQMRASMRAARDLDPCCASDSNASVLVPAPSSAGSFAAVPMGNSFQSTEAGTHRPGQS